MNKTLIIGLDAATWRVLNPLLEENRLPNIKRVVADGASGTLKSTMPPMTPLAWTSIATGVGPGKHGIYDFRKQDSGTYEIFSTDYSSMVRPAVWDVFNAYDLNVGIVNYPVAYPPESVDSFFISGFPAPDNERLAYPSEVQTYLDSVDYRTKPRRKPEDDAKAYFDEVKQIANTRCEVTIELADRYNVDLLWPVFMGIDWIQHYLWNEDINGEPAVDRFYEHMDEIIGRLLDAVDDDWNVLLISDHGFGPLAGEIHLNSLLEELGHLHRTEARASIVEELMSTVGSGTWRLGATLPFSIKHRLKKVLPKQLLSWMREGADVGTQSDLHEQIDWSKTKAFSFGSMGRIFIHTEDRFPEGSVSKEEYEEIRDQLQNELADLRRPKTDDKLFEEVLDAESVYGEHAIGGAPDLLAIPREWKYMTYGDFDEEWVHEPRRRFADHRPEGIVAASGDEIREACLSVDVTDIVSLLCYWHDIPFPEGSGTGLLSQAVESSTEFERIPPESVSVPERQASSQQVDEEVARRLDDLGYT